MGKDRRSHHATDIGNMSGLKDWDEYCYWI